MAALGPRHLQAARLYAAVILAAATAAFLTAAALTDQGSELLHVATAVVMSAMSVVLVVLPVARTTALCVLSPIVGVGGIVVLDVATRL